jgi:hypothetical protein
MRVQSHRGRVILATGAERRVRFLNESDTFKLGFKFYE